MTNQFSDLSAVELDQMLESFKDSTKPVVGVSDIFVALSIEVYEEYFRYIQFIRSHTQLRLSGMSDEVMTHEQHVENHLLEFQLLSQTGISELRAKISELETGINNFVEQLKHV